MHLRISHRTGYRYSVPIPYAIQSLRLTPVPYEGINVLRWQVEADGRSALPSLRDGFGNIVHCHTLDRPHAQTVVTAAGEVETRRADGIVSGAPEPLPPEFFLRPTPLTAVDAAIVELAHAAVAGAGDAIERLHRLMRGVHGRLAYQPGHTDAQTPAATALERGRGVCQDHAHIFIAAARAIGVPARYVSGYLWTGSDEAAHDASHAWAEAFAAGLGWIGFDAANGICPDEAYVRVAAGLDYWAAAPVRGLRSGEAVEEMRVNVQVQRASADQ
jgi:transglutaminase-like putative cysteine protease